ncbi:MAG TPA: hypothetical protein VE863_22810, partial [Pyrinomonadaceae bacterium]|nr:hypothetical protein [Pyrinomonadaceae bacterium]
MALLPTKGKAPGVYIQEITIPGAIAGTSTSIAAFVGPAQQGPLFKPSQLTNINQFENLFGSYIEDPYRIFVTHAVHAFFAEGGSECYFVRAGKGAPASATFDDRSGKGRTALVVTALAEGVAGNGIQVQVADANVKSTNASRLANANIAAGGAAANQRTVKAANANDIKTLKPGDVVLLTKGGNNERATVGSIAGDTLTTTANLTNDYGAGTIRVANLIPGQTRFRVDDSAGIEPGSYIVINQAGGSTEAAVVRVVDQVNKLLTLDKALTNTYTMDAADNAVTVVTQEFNLTVTAPGKPVENFKNLSVDPRHSHYFLRVVSSASVSVELADPPTVTLPEKNLPSAATKNLGGGADEDLNSLTPADYQNGLDTLKKIADVRIVCIPDAVGSKFASAPADVQAIQAAMISHCEKMQDRFAVLDSAPFNPTDITFNA